MSEEEEEVFSSASVFRSYKTISADTHWRSKFLKNIYSANPCL